MSVNLSPFYVVPGYTFFYWGFTLKKSVYDEYKKFFGLKSGSLVKPIELEIGRKKFDAKIRIARINNQGKIKNRSSTIYPEREVVQIIYDGEPDTLKALRKLVIFSYASTIDKSKPKLKELLEFEYKGNNIFKINVISKQETDFDRMFEFMEDKNLFAFWKDENSKKKKKKHKDNSSMDGLRSGDDGEYNYSSDDENESEDRRRQSTAESSGTNLNVDFNYGDIIERTPEEIFDTFLNSYKGFARFKELLIRDGFDDMEALIYAKKKDLLDIMPKKAAIRFYKVLKREKPHWKIVYRKQREQIEIERAEEREREERLKKEEEGWFVGEYGSEEEEDYDDELMHDGFHDGHDDY